MRIHPTITFEQYRDTCRIVIAAKAKRPQRYTWKGYLALAVACLVLGIAPQIPAARQPALTIYVLLILCWIFWKPLAKWSQERCLRRIYSEEQEKLNGQILTIDEGGISCEFTDGLTTSHHRWQGFKKRIDLPDSFLFLPTPNSFVRVPKDALELPERELIWEWSSMVPAGGR